MILFFFIANIIVTIISTCMILFGNNILHHIQVKQFCLHIHVICLVDDIFTAYKLMETTSPMLYQLLLCDKLNMWKVTNCTFKEKCKYLEHWCYDAIKLSPPNPDSSALSVRRIYST